MKGQPTHAEDIERLRQPMPTFIRSFTEVAREYNRRNPHEKPISRQTAEQTHDSAIRRIVAKFKDDPDIGIELRALMLSRMEMNT